MRLLLLIVSLAFLTACSSTDIRRDPATDLNQFKRFYVETRINDNHATDALIAAELRSRGFQATHGHLTMMPDDIEVLITYDARWTWDFRSYLIDLEITARNPHTRRLLATGNAHHPGITKKEPAKMIAAIFDKFLQ